MTDTLFDMGPREPPAPLHVVFFAAIPPDNVLREIEGAWRKAGTGDRFRAQTLHMTVLPVVALPEVPPELLDVIRDAVGGLDLGALDLAFDRLMTFNGRSSRRPIVLGTQGQHEALNRLAGELHRALTATGLKLPALRRVTPHLTLAYGAGFGPARVLPAPIAWRVDHVALVDSVQGHGQHRVLERWPLAASAPEPDAAI